MLAAKKFPPGFEWVPTVDGIQETRPPYRTVGAEILASYNLGESWPKMHRDVNRAAYNAAWLMWLCRRLKEAKVRDAATRQLDAMRQQIGAESSGRSPAKMKHEKIKRRTVGTVGASEKESSKCPPNIRTKARRCKPNAAAR